MSLTITHTAEAGTLIEGTAKGDGTAEILMLNRWRWASSIGYWYVPRSRDTAPKTHIINATASALQEAGFTVELEIDEAARPTAIVEADKAARAEARADALDAKAERKAGEADAAEKAHRGAVERLPYGGEPVKIGHHSENRHRRDLDRAHAALGKSVEADREAERVAEAAKTARAATGAHNAPATVSNRIDKLKAEARALLRTLDGYTEGRGTPYAREIPAETGERRERTKAQAVEVAEQLAYWEGVRAEQIASGITKAYSAENVVPGDFVRVSGIWWKVKRASAKTVSVESQGCSTRAPYGTIQGHRTAAEVEAAVAAKNAK